MIMHLPTKLDRYIDRATNVAHLIFALALAATAIFIAMKVFSYNPTPQQTLAVDRLVKL